MSKRYPAQHIRIFAIYKKFWIFGNHCRTFEIALPNLKDAEEWIENQECIEKNDFMIEEMSAVMKAWQP